MSQQQPLFDDSIGAYLVAQPASKADVIKKRIRALQKGVRNRILGIDGDSVRLALKDRIALVNIADLPLIGGMNWHAKRSSSSVHFYARAHVPGSGKCGKDVMMHRLVMGVDRAVTVDHRNGDTLDNRRSNLRVCTTAENVRNSKLRITSGRERSSQFKGVSVMRNGMYRAQIMANYHKINLGAFATEEEAARAYDAAARRLHGEFARTNFTEAA